jgi:phage virion morphogenesis protein
MASITLATQDINALLATAYGVSQTTTLMARIGRAIHTNTLMNFKRGVEPDGTPWLPITHRSGQPLRDTGRLQRSITWESDKDTAVVGTNVVYARAHNFGVVGGVPPRTFLGLAAPQHAIVERIADKWMNEVLDANPA